MDLTDIFAVFHKWSDSTKEFDALRAWLESAVVLARAQVLPATDPQPLTKHFADLSSAEALRLSASLPSPLAGDVYTRIEELRRSQASSSEHAWEILRGIESLRDRLDVVARRSRRRALGVAVLKVMAYVGPVVIAYMAGTYFRFYNNVVWDSDLILSPPSTYEYRGGRYEMDQEYLSRFYREFSRYYFDRDNSFEEQFLRGRLAMPASFDKPGTQPDSPGTLEARRGGRYGADQAGRDVKINLGAIKLRVVFRNPGRAAPLLISSIETRATYHRRPFDWSLVDATTDLDVALDNSGNSVRLTDRGVGPAMDVEYSTTAGGMMLLKRSYPYVLNDDKRISLSSADGVGVVSLELRSATSKGLGSPVYWSIRDRNEENLSPSFDPDKSSTRGNVRNCGDGRQYEIVQDADRLAQLTETVRGGPVQVHVTFTSLRNQTATKSVEGMLPADHVFARTQNKLNESDPCRPPPTGAPAPPLPEPLARFIDKLAEGKNSLQGGDLIKAESTLDLLGVPDAGVTGVVASPDEILNPGGFVMFDVTIGNANSGSVDLEFNVNGVKLRNTSVQLLVPEDTKFLPRTPDKTAHFRP